MDINKLLSYTVTKNASDLHLSSGRPPLVRIDGELCDIPNTSVLDDKDIIAMLNEVVPKDIAKDIPEKMDIDLSITARGISRFRLNIFRQYRGIAAAFRTIPIEIPTIEGLGLPEIFYKLCELPHGLILVTGPTGSGKTTTIAAMIDYINKNKKGHILTIEDPIEYVHKCNEALVQQREIKTNTASFQTALRAALREDPDYILVGEMRDLETIQLALTAAETGHLVFATLHTSSAAKTIDRIIDVFPMFEKEMVRSMLSESLQAVVSQVLVKKVDGGRTVSQEIMLCTTAIRNMIRENKTHQLYSVIQTGQALGMQTLEQSLENLVAQKIIDKDVALENLLTIKEK